MPEVGEVSVAAEKEVASYKEMTDQLHPDCLRCTLCVCVCVCTGGMTENNEIYNIIIIYHLLD